MKDPHLEDTNSESGAGGGGSPRMGAAVCVRQGVGAVAL